MALTAVAVVIIVGIAGVLAVGWIWAGRRMYPPVRPLDHTLSDYPALHAEEVSFPSSTGIQLEGRFLAGRSGATIVLTHGHGGTQDEMLPVADVLVRAGFSVLTYNSRGRGGSGGSATFGELEREDVTAAVDYVVSRSDTDPDRIGALGFSVGAAATIMAAADDPRIKAVVDDSGWSDVDHWIGAGAREKFRVAPVPAAMVKLLEIRSGVDFADLRPVDVVGRISPRPLLIVHGDADSLIRPFNADELYAAAGTGRELWLVPDAAHGDTVALRDPDYAERVAAFFTRSLQP